METIQVQSSKDTASVLSYAIGRKLDLTPQAQSDLLLECVLEKSNQHILS